MWICRSVLPNRQETGQPLFPGQRKLLGNALSASSTKLKSNFGLTSFGRVQVTGSINTTGIDSIHWQYVAIKKSDLSNFMQNNHFSVQQC